MKTSVYASRNDVTATHPSNITLFTEVLVWVASIELA
jgi:hypothetical protein